MANRPSTPDEITALRKQTVQRSEGRAEIAQALFCDRTGGGVITTSSTREPGSVRAHFFRKGVYRRIWKSRQLQSAHEKIDPLAVLRAELAAFKAAKAAPHDIRVGEILARIWGCTMRDVDFYKVVAVEPRAVVAIRLPSRMLSGDWMSGEKVPDTLSPEDEAGTSRETFKISMESGEARVTGLNSITSMQRWDGSPVHIYCD